jgi:hypothetical protein
MSSRELERMLQQAVSFSIGGAIVVPEGYRGEANIIVPDEIVLACIDRYGLCGSGVKVVDPMCGVGTIPRVITANGGYCDAAEINKERYQAAVRSCGATAILVGDFRQIQFPQPKYDCIFTSLPFAWFKDKQSMRGVEESYIKRFDELLVQNGFVLLDSMPLVQRMGEDWHVAQFQSEYFIEHGFSLSEVLVFDNKEHADINAQSVILRFDKC